MQGRIKISVYKSNEKPAWLHETLDLADSMFIE